LLAFGEDGCGTGRNIALRSPGGMNTGWDNLTEASAAWSVDLRLQLILAGLSQQITARPIPD
jgi:hypothetical protein